ncbi:MAG: heparinase II/III family protein [Clostridia bacterium]|nr:heparinase II/III family protein [Clostridia bacterium]
MAPISAFSATAAELLNIKFDNFITNRGIENVVVSEGDARVVSDRSNNKAYFFPENYGRLSETLSSEEDAFTFSISIKAAKKSSIQVHFGSKENEMSVTLINIKDNKLLDSKKASVASLKTGAYSNITVAVDNVNLIYDLYLDGKSILNDVPFSKRAGKYLTIENLNGNTYIDNVCAKSGIFTSISGSFVSYNNTADAWIDYDYFTNSDVCFVDIEAIDDVSYAKGLYKYFDGAASPKGNKITLNRIEQRDNPNRNNSYIVMEKTTSENCHYDFYSPEQRAPKYGYFPSWLYTGSVKIDEFGAPVYFAYLRDVLTTGEYQILNPVYIDESGKVITSGGKLVKTLSKGEWLNFKIAVDTKYHDVRIYIDEKPVDNFPIPETFKTLQMLRLVIEFGGNCTATFDKLKLIGMRNRYDHRKPDYHEPQMSNDRGIERFLAGKVAFYAYSENVFSGGKKYIRVDKPLMIDDVLYVSAGALGVGYGESLVTYATAKTATGNNLKLTADSRTVIYNGAEYNMSLPCIWENDRLYIPVAQFASEVLKHCVRTDGQGLVVTSSSYFDLYTEDTKADIYIQGAHRFEYDYYKNMTPLRVLNHYMQFERPDKETLKNDFNKKTGNGKLRPRVLASKKEFDKVRNYKDSDSYLNGIVNEIVERANSYLANSEYGYEIENSQDMLKIARGYKLEVETLAFAYQITGNEDYAAKVWNTLETVFSYPDWNYSHLIDSGEMAAWTAIAYDWCYDYFDDNQKKYIEENMVKFIIDPYTDIIRDLRFTRETMANAGDYVTGKTNFNAVCNGGTIAACIALADVYPEKCFELLTMAVRSFENVLLAYRPDGAWPESPSYWEYCTQYAGRGVSSLINAMGQHYGLLDAQGFKESAQWVMQNNSYGGSYAYHDAELGTTSSKMSTLISYYTGNENLQKACYEQSASGIRTRWPEDALYYNPHCEGDADKLPHSAFYDGLDLAYSRSSFLDKKGFYFATHAGIVKPYHAQADVGTFVFDLNGVRWAEDIGKENYVVMRGGGKVAYRQAMQGHSVVVHDPPTNAWGMNYDGGEIPLIRYEDNDYAMTVSYDMRLAYKQFVSQHNRGFYVGDNFRSLTVQDSFTTLKAMDSYWFMQTPATSIDIIDNQTAILHKNGKALRMEVRCDVPGYELGYGPAQSIEGTEHHRYEGENPNTAYQRMHIKMPVQAGKTYTVTVKMYTYGERGISSIDEMTVPMAEWELPEE